MKFTLSWLKDHLKTSATVDEIATKLSEIGLEVEHVEDLSQKLKSFVVARILEARKHPNADRLQIVMVEIAKGQPPVEVVCGAPNARTGLISVFAPIGTYIPGSKITLEKKPVRGVVSNGMMCSAAELELSEDSKGILELESSFSEKVGISYVEVAGLADPTFDVKLTPNRPDCTGVRGIARDLAAAGLGSLKHDVRIHGVEGAFDSPFPVKKDLPKEAANAALALAFRYVKDVKNSSSPEWLQQRLMSVGLRPINALVDITNYISQDRGRPLHVYDADKLRGTIVARLGKSGEKLLALDGKEYTIDTTMCVIADDSGVLGLGGIIGGEKSGCTEHTRNVLIECALFDPIRTASTGRKLGIVSDARYRFERGVDPQSVLYGLDLATQFIEKLCGGKPSKAILAGYIPSDTRTISFNTELVTKLSGMKIEKAEIQNILEALGCTLSGTGSVISVTPPSWRPDIHGNADLVEEVVRIGGLNRIPSTPLVRHTGIVPPTLTSRQRMARRARLELAARGFVETITWSFISRKDSIAFGGGSDLLELSNPISADLSSMRPSLLPGLLNAVARNANRGYGDVALFELGQVYIGDKPNEQILNLGGVRSQTAKLSGSGRHWDRSNSMVTVFDAKADTLSTLTSFGLNISNTQITTDAPHWYHPGQSGVIRQGPKTVLAHFGELHPSTLKTLDVTEPVVAFEIFLDSLPPLRKMLRTKNALQYLDLLPIRRDFAFILDNLVPAGDVIKAAMGADENLISQVSLFDVFEGGSLAKEGKKSLAIEVVLQPLAQTFTEKDIEEVSQKIISNVKKATGGEIRS